MQFAHATTAIDTIKDAKSTALKTMVSDEKFRKPLQAMVDAEAQLAKAAVSAMEEFFSKFKAA